MVSDSTGRKLLKFKIDITLFLMGVYKTHLTIWSRNARSTLQVISQFLYGNTVDTEAELLLTHGRSYSHLKFPEIFFRFPRFENLLDYRSNMKSKQDTVTI